MYKEYSLQPVPLTGRSFTWWHMSLIWGGNHALLYSTSLSLAALAGSRHPKRCAALSGIIGTGMALSGLGASLEHFLLLLSYVLPALLGMFLVHIFIVTKYFPDAASSTATWAALCLGSVVPLFLPEGATIAAGLAIGGGVWGGSALFKQDKRR